LLAGALRSYAAGRVLFLREFRAVQPVSVQLLLELQELLLQARHVVAAGNLVRLDALPVTLVLLLSSLPRAQLLVVLLRDALPFLAVFVVLAGLLRLRLLELTRNLARLVPARDR